MSSSALVAVVVAFTSFMICWVFAGVVTEAILASAARAVPVPRRRRFPRFRWRYVLIGLIWAASLAWPVAAVVFHVAMIYQLLVGAEIATSSLAPALTEIIRKGSGAKDIGTTDQAE